MLLLQEIVCVKKKNDLRHKKTRKHLAEALIISEIDYGNIIHSNAPQNPVI